MTTHKKPDEDDKRSHHRKPAREPTRHPQPGDDTSRQDDAADAPAGAEASAGGLSDETVEETEARDRAVRAQVQDFVENLPPGAEEGLYSATAHDRWSNGPYQPDIPDGHYHVEGSDWLISFHAGRIYYAQQQGRLPIDESETIIEIPG